MSASRAVARNTAVLFTGTLVAKGLVFASYVVLTRTLGVEGFGRYVYVFTALAFFELLADAGLDPLLVRDGARGREDLPCRLGDAFVLRALLTLAAAAAAFVLVPRFSGRPEDGALVLLAAASLLATNRRPSLRSLLEVPARTRLRMELPTALGALTEIAALGLLVVLAARFGIAGAIAAQPLAQIPMAFVYAALLARSDLPRFAPDVRRIAELLKRASPLLGALALNIVLVRADVLFLERWRGPAEVGIYSAPVRLVEIANLLPALLMTSVFPLLVGAFERDRGEAVRLYSESIRVSMIALVPFVLVQILFADSIVRALFGAEFGRSAAVLPWLALAELWIYLDIFLGARLVAEHQERRNFLLLGAAAAFNLAGNAAVVPAFGAPGAAAVTLGSYAVRLGAGLLSPSTRSAVAESIAAARPSWIAGALALAAGWAMRTAAAAFGDAPAAGAAATLLAALSTFAIASVRMGGTRPGDLAFLRRFAGRRLS